jgi:hypothetical protein
MGQDAISDFFKGEHRVLRTDCPVAQLADTLERRSLHPRSTARIVRSRKPLVAVASGVFNSVCACSTVSQFPSRSPLDATPFTRVIPLAGSGACQNK